jgi:hypothetical protein
MRAHFRCGGAAMWRVRRGVSAFSIGHEGLRLPTHQPSAALTVSLRKTNLSV